MHYIITALGCKVNQYEAQAIETLLHPHGFTAAGEGDPVDLIVVNTCAVTAEGGRKSRQMIRKLREEHPQALCAVCGCWSQLSPEDAAAIGADVVHGSGSKQAFVDDILRAFREHTPVTCVDNPFRRFDFEPLPAGAAYGRTRAMLKIQDGCNNFCTYCVIPYTRGRIRSLPPDEMARQAAHLAEEGYRELVLTGIEIASYGRDLPGALTLAAAVETVAAAAPQMRLRLGSIEPTVITEDFCRRAAATGQVGVVRRDPMAMLPFCGYHMGDYWQHWLDMGKKIPKPPKIFNVNWFRTDEDGNFAWPGFGDNMRVLQWIISRADDEIGAAETALGYEPNTHDIDMEGLEMSMYDMRRLLSVDRELWLQECEDAREYYEKIGKVPPELYEELDALEMRLNRGYKVKHE